MYFFIDGIMCLPMISQLSTSSADYCMCCKWAQATGNKKCFLCQSEVQDKQVLFLSI